MVTILVYPDFHGTLPSFREKADFSLAPGDFCHDKVKKYIFQSIEEWKSGKPRRHWTEIIGKAEGKKEAEKSLQKGREVLERLNRSETYVVPGNWDWTGEDASFTESDWDFLSKNHFTSLTKGLENIIDCHFNLVKAGDYQVIGYGVNSYVEYPQDKDELSSFPKNLLESKEREWKKSLQKIDSLFKKAKKPVIFLTHNQPFGTELDKIRNPDSPRDGMHMGSLVIKEMIEKHQPLLSVGGHMHENFGFIRMGETICINSGLGPDQHVMVELDGDSLKKVQFKGSSSWIGK